MSEVKCFRKIDQLLTLRGADEKSAKYTKEDDLGVINNAAMLIDGEQVLWVGEDTELKSRVLKELVGSHEVEEVRMKGYSIMPAFVECHTHSVFAGDRKSEFELRNQGVSYQQIAEQGGGILSTVEQTRLASKRQLIDLAQDRVNRFVEQGVAVLEIKSGYALDEKNEVKILSAIQSLSGVKIIGTFLGAHSYPKEVSAEEYQTLLLEKLLPKIAHQKLAQRVDIFIEKGYFDIVFAQKYFELARSLNLECVAHIDQLSRTSDKKTLLDFGVRSFDHLVEVSSDDIRLLSQYDTTAVLLPAADFYLKTAYPPARELIDGGVRVAISSDFNPGSSPTQSVSLVGLLARLEMKMTLAETIVAYTLGAAHALGLGSEHGALVPSKKSDFIVLESNYQDLFYDTFKHPVLEVWRNGQKQGFHKKT